MNSLTCKRAADPTQKSAHVDFDAPISGLGNALGSRNQRLAHAAGGNFDAIGRRAALDKVVAHTSRPLTLQQREALYESFFADDIRKLEEMTGRDLSCWDPQNASG